MAKQAKADEAAAVLEAARVAEQAEADDAAATRRWRRTSVTDALIQVETARVAEGAKVNEAAAVLDAARVAEQTKANESSAFEVARLVQKEAVVVAAAAGEMKRTEAVAHSYRLVLSANTQHVIGLDNDDSDVRREVLAQFDDKARMETNAATGKVRISYSDEAQMDDAKAWVKAREIVELEKHVVRECVHLFCASTREAAERATKKEVVGCEGGSSTSGRGAQERQKTGSAAEVDARVGDRYVIGGASSIGRGYGGADRKHY